MTESNAASSFETGFAYQNEYNYKNGYVLSCIFSFDPFLGLGGCIVLLKSNMLYRFPTMLLSFAILSQLGGCVEFWKYSIGGSPIL